MKRQLKVKVQRNWLISLVEKNNLFISILIAMLGGVFYLGSLFGGYKYDKEKNDLYSENIQLKTLKITLLDSINNTKNTIIDTVLKENKLKELIVYNYTNENKMFRCRDKVTGKGEGRVIKPKGHHIFKIEGTVYQHSYHNVIYSDQNFYDIVDTLKIGELTMKLPGKELVILDK